MIQLSPMDFVTALGFFGAFLGMITFLPQVIQVVKTKRTEDISLVTFIIILINNLVWIVYGYFRRDLAIILINVFVFISSSIIVFYKVKFR